LKMAWNKYGDFVNRVRLSQVPPLICLLGADLYLRGQLIEIIEQKLGKGKKVERESFYATESSPQSALMAARTYSMFAQEKIILVHQFQAWKQKERDEMAAVLEKPNPGAIVVLIAEDPPPEYYEKLSYNKWFKTASGSIEVVDLTSLKPDELREVVKEIAQKFEKRISDEAVDLLIDLVGARPELLYLELEKFSLFLGGAKVISPELVSEMVMGSKLQNIFELAESLGKKDIERSLRIYRKMCEANPTHDSFWFLGILSIVRRQYRILLELQSRLGAERNLKEVMDRYNIPFPLRRDYEQQAESLQKGRLLDFFEQLHESEREIKTSAHNNNIILERLIMKLCGN
jgi:DNA polymerase III subunit delta